MKTVVGHYRGKIFAWDVVNEAFSELQPGEPRSTIWRDQAGIGLAKNGSSYIERCFRWAHEADPQALLFYSEAEAEAVNPKSDARMQRCEMSWSRLLASRWLAFSASQSAAFDRTGRSANDQRQWPTTPYNVISPWLHRIQFATKPRPPAAGNW